MSSCQLLLQGNSFHWKSWLRLTIVLTQHNWVENNLFLARFKSRVLAKWEGLQKNSKNYCNFGSILNMVDRRQCTMNRRKKVWKWPQNVFQPAFGCEQHPKAGQNTSQLRLFRPYEKYGTLSIYVTSFSSISINSFNFAHGSFCSSTRIGKGQSLDRSKPYLILIHMKRRTDFRQASALSNLSVTFICVAC